ncbi:hypothetical protein F7725_005396 [Dissostichus mawsoni]|uniref:Uncharacterized protein n=1 Tax=Dissostichus mawsoni TaxID=36200 RepID=A0A7J5YSY3_DISMA|nr:hypothetical protein F7725_005396 [Dissostichus mawsoni]
MKLPYHPATHRHINSDTGSTFCRQRPLLLRLWNEPVRQEGADFAEQRVRCVRPRPAGDRCEHRLLAVHGGGVILPLNQSTETN